MKSTQYSRHFEIREELEKIFSRIPYASLLETSIMEARLIEQDMKLKPFLLSDFE